MPRGVIISWCQLIICTPTNVLPPKSKDGQLSLKGQCPSLDFGDKTYELFELFKVDDIITIFRLLLLEHKIVIVDDDYARLNRVTYYFMELLYPFEWSQTYIPLMTIQMTNHLQAIVPFLVGIEPTLMEIASNKLDEPDKEELFIVHVKQNEQSLIFRFKKGKLKHSKASKVEHLPKDIKDVLINKLKEIIKNKKNNNNIDNINLEIRDCFIEIFVKMFHSINKYLCLLDEEVAFNKNLFLEKVKKDDQNFYSAVTETTIFYDFINKFVNEEYKYKYLRKKIEKYNENDKTNKAFKTFGEKHKVNKKYKIEPDYLKINEKKIKDNNSRIAESIQKIDSVSKDFESKDFDIYLIPDKTEELKKQEENIKLENKEIAHIENIDEDKKKGYEIRRRLTTLALKEKKK